MLPTLLYLYVITSHMYHVIFLDGVKQQHVCWFLMGGHMWHSYSTQELNIINYHYLGTNIFSEIIT
jgi:hypothetical protein